MKCYVDFFFLFFMMCFLYSIQVKLVQIRDILCILQDFMIFMIIIYCFYVLQGEKILLFLYEEEFLEEDFIVFFQEFIMGGFISYLFIYEEQTIIINFIRIEVIQVGFIYIRDVAWNFFFRYVCIDFFFLFMF